MTIQTMIFIYLYNKILYQYDEIWDGNDRRSIISVGRRIAGQDRPRPIRLERIDGMRGALGDRRRVWIAPYGKVIAIPTALLVGVTMVETFFIHEDRSTFRPFRFSRRLFRSAVKMVNGLATFTGTVTIISTACMLVLLPIAIVLSNFKSIEIATLDSSIRVFSLIVGLVGWALLPVLKTRRQISKPLVFHESHSSIEAPNASTGHESPRS